jgi:hypothetical protein
MTFAILDAKQPSDAGHSTSKSWHCKAKIVGKSMRWVRGAPPILFQSMLAGSTDPDLQRPLDDIRARKIDVIVADKADALARWNRRGFIRPSWI